MESRNPSPRRVEAGRRSAQRRWGPPRILRIGDLTPEQRRLVLALVDAAREEREAVSDAAA